MWLTILIILVLFFLYSQLVSQYKTGDHLDMFDIQYMNPSSLQTQCRDKMPLWFEFASVLNSVSDGKPHFLNVASLDTIAQRFGEIDVNVRDTFNLAQPPAQVPLSSLIKIIKTDPHSHYISENNESFINQTVLEEYLFSLHEFLKPSLTIHTNLDILFGSRGATTQLQYNIDDRMFLYVPPASSRIELMITPYKRTKYLGKVKADLRQLEFTSPMNPWPSNTAQQRVEQVDPETGEPLPIPDEKVATGFKHFWINGGDMVYIPPYYWYTIRYSDDGAFAYSIRYQTIMNVLAHAHLYGQYAYKAYVTEDPKVSMAANKREDVEVVQLHTEPMHQPLMQ
jgi:hypothetical protein